MDTILKTLTDEVQSLAETTNESLRRRAIDRLRDLQYKLETPEETMQRLMHAGLTTASIRVSLDLDIFNKLVEVGRPMELTELAGKCGADPVLLGRLLRHQASLGIVHETAKDTFTHSQTARNLSNPNIAASIKFYTDVLGPAFASTPSFLAACRYKNPNDRHKSPFNTAWDTQLSLYDWLSRHPEHRKHFDLLMNAQRSSVKDCFSCFDVGQEAEGWPSEKPFFVDVGGGVGQQCVALKKRWPELNLKVVLQDLPDVVNNAQLPEDIDAMAHDFFTEQPIKGAKFYYLRNNMHDHTDEKCREILKHLRDAMSEDSALLIDDIVVPDEKVDWYVTQTDLAMMVQFSSMDRTEGQWRELLTEAGLKVKSITTYTHSFQLSIIVATK